MMELKGMRNFLFDLDGTIWKWSSLLPDADRVISRLQEKKKEIFFVTNNAASSKRGIVERLGKLGIKTSEDHVFTSGESSALFFEGHGIRDLYFCGESGLSEELQKHGVRTSEKAKHVLISTDRNFTYWKLKKIFDLHKSGAKLYCTGVGRHWYVGDDIYPGELPLVAAVEAMTGVKPMLLGKPSDIMKSYVLDRTKFYPESTMLIGDDVATDILFGNKCGFRTALVMTGDAKEKPVDLDQLPSEAKPSMVFKSLSDILRKI